MSKINKKYIIYIVILIINILVIYFIAQSRYINRMPGPVLSINTIKESSFNNFSALYLGYDFIVVVMAIISTILGYLSQKYLIKNKKNFVSYTLIFIALLIIDMIIYNSSIQIIY